MSRFRALQIAGILLVPATISRPARAQSAYVRVSQAGYEAGKTPFRAYLMSTKDAAHATFAVANSNGVTVNSGHVGALLGTWGHSKKVSYNVYALDFSAPAGDLYTISVAGRVAAMSPRFAVDDPDTLYSGLLLNTLFFYQTERDGARFIQNALRSKPGHLKDKNAYVYQTPPLDSDDFIDNAPPAPPLVSAGVPNIDVSGGWWDAGDYEKYVETVSYTAALMQIGIRDFPNQMGSNAPLNPVAPPGSISYAGDSGPGAPASSDFTDEARFGINWLMKMWDDKTQTLFYQVDNSQDWDYYGEGDPSSASGNCGGTYSTPYCLITNYDIWILPQAADHFRQSGDPEPCDMYTTFFICDRPVFVAGPPGSLISPNLAGRLAADFALCYQLNHNGDRALANQCLRNAEDIFALADLSYPDPAPGGGSGTCTNCLLTVVPFDGYPENVWDDDMELGATELYFAIEAATDDGSLSPGLSHNDGSYYLSRAAEFAKHYIANVYDAGDGDTLNLYDVSGLAHFELYRALQMAGNPGGFALSGEAIRKQLLRQVNDAIAASRADAWGFGYQWSYGDTTSHGGGLSVMASEAYDLTGSKKYDRSSQRWLANVLGTNAWGSSFIVGDGSTSPNCIQHQVANLSGALDGTSGGTPILWGAAVEGPAGYATSGQLDGMNLCPANGVDAFRKFNGNNGSFAAAQVAVYRDNMQSYTTTEPAIDLTSTSFLMWSWRMAQHPSAFKPASIETHSW
jgi:endoglucanase